jgi:7-carboxy-7-deazaguanine synthase (Cx14CxxC type)
MYSVKEVFYTLQGEGANTGTPAVFLRFAGCNLWSGREKGRASAVCRFCDTDFVGTDGAGGGQFRTAAALAKAVAAKWPKRAKAPRSFSKSVSSSVSSPVSSSVSKFVVCTGGEPLLQLDSALLNALHDNGFRVAVETNGTLPAPRGIDWTCVSPKARAPLALKRGDELKLVYPQAGADPERFSGLDFGHFFLQPMDGPRRIEYTRLAADYCLRHPRWRLSLQVHKLIGMP